MEWENFNKLSEEEKEEYYFKFGEKKKYITPYIAMFVGFINILLISSMILEVVMKTNLGVVMGESVMKQFIDVYGIFTVLSVFLVIVVFGIEVVPEDKKEKKWLDSKLEVEVTRKEEVKK